MEDSVKNLISIGVKFCAKIIRLICLENKTNHEIISKDFLRNFCSTRCVYDLDECRLQIQDDRKLGLRGILRGSLFILIILLTLTLFPWVLRRQLKALERSSNTELWYITHPNISTYLNFSDNSNCKFCRNATKICQTSNESDRGNGVAYFILSYIKNQRQRQTIRRTWASGASLRPVFVMGVHSDESDMISATREADEYGDMIIESFADTFANATLKTASILKHFNQFCGNVSYLMKTEDDVFVNRDIVEGTVRQYMNETQENLKIIGYTLYDSLVVRNIRSIWYVGHTLRRDRMYPTYASRMGYLLPGKRVKEILDKSPEIPILPVEDAYWTGLVASAINLPHSMDTTFNGQALRVKTYCALRSQSIVHTPNSIFMEKLWSILQRNNPTVCFTLWNRLMMKLFS